MIGTQPDRSYKSLVTEGLSRIVGKCILHEFFWRAAEPGLASSGRNHSPKPSLGAVYTFIPFGTDPLQIQYPRLAAHVYDAALPDLLLDT